MILFNIVTGPWTFFIGTNVVIFCINTKNFCVHKKKTQKFNLNFIVFVYSNLNDDILHLLLSYIDTKDIVTCIKIIYLIINYIYIHNK